MFAWWTDGCACTGWVAMSASTRKAFDGPSWEGRPAVMRRSSRPFRRAWDAAMLVAREGAAGELAERALNGVEEPVFYAPVLSACLGRQSKGARRSGSA